MHKNGETIRDHAAPSDDTGQIQQKKARAADASRLSEIFLPAMNGRLKLNNIGAYGQLCTDKAQRGSAGQHILFAACGT